MKPKLFLCLALLLNGFCFGCKKPGTLAPSAEQIVGIVGKGTSKVLKEAEVSRAVAVELMVWGILGPIPQVDPEYTRMEESVIQKIHGVRGYSESDDFHGDGTDWYEVDLSPEMAATLRTNLSQLPTFKNTRPIFFNNAPSWWPAQWPAGTQIYEKDLKYFVLPDSGTRAWFMRIRT
jgi:hypothetical protein